MATTLVNVPLSDFEAHWQLPHQAAIARGVGIAALGGAFGITMAVIAGGRTFREVALPGLMYATFWGLLTGLTVYATHNEQG